MSGIAALLLRTSGYPTRITIRRAMLEDRLRVLEAVYEMLEKVEGVEEAKKRVLMAVHAVRDALEDLPETDYVISILLE